MRLQRTISNSVKGAVFRSGCGQQYTNLWWMMRARSVSPWVDWNVEKNAVFIHVPKNAGTSLYKILEITEPSETHCTALGYRSSNPRLWSQAYTFAFCRNPWDRFVSAFHYLKHKPISADDEAWSKEVLGPFETFADFAEEMDRPSFRSAVFMWRHFAPQWYYLSDLSGRMIVDHVARFENLSKEVERLAPRLGAKGVSVRTNAVERGHYSSYYTHRLQRIVADAYARDIDLFGYSFNTGSP